MTFSNQTGVDYLGKPFLEWLEQHTMGLHGLFTTPSSRASGFDNDLLTAGLPDGTV